MVCCLSERTRYNPDRPDGITIGHGDVHDAEDAAAECKRVTQCFIGCQKNINEDFSRGRYLACCAKQMACITGAILVTITAVAAFIIAAQNADSADFTAGCIEICETVNGFSECSCLF